MIDAYTIKSYTRQAYKNYGDASRVKDVVFYWSLMHLDKPTSSRIRSESIIAAIKRKGGLSISIEFDPSGLRHLIHAGCCTLVLTKECFGCKIMIEGCRRSEFNLTYQNPGDVADIIIAYPDYLPMIEDELYSCVLEGQKKKILCDMNNAVARGIIIELERAREISMPRTYRIIGRDHERVTLYVTWNLRFSCSLTHLRAMLKRKFPYTSEK